MIKLEELSAFVVTLSNKFCESDDPYLVAMQSIAEAFQHFHWVGIYWLDNDKLTLGPFVGDPTEHTQISVGQGVCGTAISEERNQIVHDVRERSNYLSCSMNVRSEIVVLVRNRRGEIIGQIDADSHNLGAFDESDEAMLEHVARLLTERIE